jgi:hypothetical protein
MFANDTDKTHEDKLAPENNDGSTDTINYVSESPSFYNDDHSAAVDAVAAAKAETEAAAAAIAEAEAAARAAEDLAIEQFFAETPLISDVSMGDFEDIRNLPPHLHRRNAHLHRRQTDPRGSHGYVPTGAAAENARTIFHIFAGHPAGEGNNAGDAGDDGEKSQGGGGSKSDRGKLAGGNDVALAAAKVKPQAAKGVSATEGPMLLGVDRARIKSMLEGAHARTMTVGDVDAALALVTHGTEWRKQRGKITADEFVRVAAYVDARRPLLTRMFNRFFVRYRYEGEKTRVRGAVLREAEKKATVTGRTLFRRHRPPVLVCPNAGCGQAFRFLSDLHDHTTMACVIPSPTVLETIAVGIVEKHTLWNTRKVRIRRATRMLMAGGLLDVSLEVSNGGLTPITQISRLEAEIDMRVRAPPPEEIERRRLAELVRAEKEAKDAEKARAAKEAKEARAAKRAYDKKWNRGGDESLAAEEEEKTYGSDGEGGTPPPSAVATGRDAGERHMREVGGGWFEVSTKPVVPASRVDEWSGTRWFDHPPLIEPSTDHESQLFYVNHDTQQTAWALPAHAAATAAGFAAASGQEPAKRVDLGAVGNGNGGISDEASGGDGGGNGRITRTSASKLSQRPATSHCSGGGGSEYPMMAAFPALSASTQPRPSTSPLPPGRDRLKQAIKRVKMSRRAVSHLEEAVDIGATEHKKRAAGRRVGPPEAVDHSTAPHPHRMDGASQLVGDPEELREAKEAAKQERQRWLDQARATEEARGKAMEVQLAKEAAVQAKKQERIRRAKERAAQLAAEVAEQRRKEHEAEAAAVAEEAAAKAARRLVRPVKCVSPTTSLVGHARPRSRGTYVGPPRAFDATLGAPHPHRFDDEQQSVAEFEDDEEGDGNVVGRGEHTRGVGGGEGRDGGVLVGSGGENEMTKNGGKEEEGKDGVRRQGPFRRPRSAKRDCRSWKDVEDEAVRAREMRGFTHGQPMF